MPKAPRKLTPEISQMLADWRARAEKAFAEYCEGNPDTPLGEWLAMSPAEQQSELDVINARLEPAA